ncbi:hypothetical protein GH714_031223 [Hevea brasiliensis]|uniref:Magnesium transporter n=1 Tax=Hevea brasiliensis TaxID=3981 RepID=A0A6A6N694_HEVBR|nr:hypothetical protein GH714_031223 [Hevea brasiliensis]
MRSHLPPLSKPTYPQPDDDSDPLTRPAAASVLPTVRKKGTGVRPWLLLDNTGQAQVVEAGKHAIMRRTGLPARDLRILDPQLSYPSTILGRERAIVINLEHIKAIITAQEVLLLNSKDPSVTPFVEELKTRLLGHYNATKAQECYGDDSNWKNLYDPEEPQSRENHNNFPGGFQDQDERDKVDAKPGLENRNGPNVLPFEFVALEACLEAACSCLENEAKTLEQEAHPALDKLTSKISTLNLERVRQIKSRLVAITGRVQKVRDELEHLLDDDEDMAEMYLTEKLVQHLENSSTTSLNERDDMDDEYLPVDLDDRIPAEVSLEAHGPSTSGEGDIHNADNPQDHLFSAPHMLSRGSHGTHTSTTRSAISKHLDVEELEMLLEAYFVQIDGTLNKLSTVSSLIIALGSSDSYLNFDYY